MKNPDGKLCPCGFPQSHPIPHEHDQTEREKQIIYYFEHRSGVGKLSPQGNELDRDDIVRLIQIAQKIYNNVYRASTLKMDSYFHDLGNVLEPFGDDLYLTESEWEQLGDE